MVIAPAGTPNAGTVYVANPGIFGKGRDGNTVTAIKPDGVTSTITVGDVPEGMVIAPLGTPNAGTLYVSNYGNNGAGNTVSVVRPDGTISTFTISGQTPSPPAVAPTGTPNAGTVYVIGKSGDSGILTVLLPTGGVKTSAAAVGYCGQGVVIAPLGTPHAGSVYVCDEGPASSGGEAGGEGSTVTEIRPDGTTTMIAVGKGAGGVAIAPAGTPNAGTIYVANVGSYAKPGNTISTVAPDGTTATLAVGTQPGLPVIAPKGTPNAGSVYVANNLRGNGSTVTVIETDGRIKTVATGLGPQSVAIAGGL